MGIRTNDGKRESTEHVPPTLFCPFKKTSIVNETVNVGPFPTLKMFFKRVKRLLGPFDRPQG
jgi:hypothetical protein